MSFSRDVRHYAMTPRSLQTSKFGPYSVLTVERKRNAKALAWMLAYGVGIGIFWWLIVAIRAGIAS